MNADERRLLELAARVSDGVEIDWVSAERSAADDEDRRTVRHLRLVQDLAEVHRSGAGEPVSRERLLEMTASIRTAEIPSPGVPPESPARWGRLEIREELGRGAYGTVYRAWDANLQTEVALKLIDPSAAARGFDEEVVLREGRLLARLRHPNVITVHGAEIHDGRVGLSMELVRGSTLARLLRKQGRFGAHEAALIAIDVCRALAAVHGAGLVHRDVKSQNVMRGDGGRILLMDFGAVRDLAELEKLGGAEISGTPLYMAPETILEHRSTPRSDLYSLGVLMFRLVTASYPVQASSVNELAEKHRNRDARLLRDARSDLPEPFVKVVERALAWRPGDRFGSAGEMELALCKALGIDHSRPATAPEPDGKRSARPRRRVSRLPWLAIGAMALISAALFVYWRLSVAPTGEPAAAESAVAVPGAYEIEASLYRIGISGRRELLVSGDLLHVGDDLSLEVEGSVPLQVYVFSEDEEGRAYALFPIPGLNPQNPLPAGVRLELPGKDAAGTVKRWRVDSVGGREHLVIIASPEALPDVEDELVRLPRPAAGAAAMPLPEATAIRLRGIGSLVESGTPSESGSAGRLFEMARELAGGAETVSGVWIRRIELVYSEK